MSSKLPVLPVLVGRSSQRPYTSDLCKSLLVLLELQWAAEMQTNLVIKAGCFLQS